jgi:hypothetical protein
MILFSSCYVKPVKVEAAATTVAVAGAVTVAAAIAALGIGVSGAMNTPAYNKACQNIWDGMSSAVQKGAIWVSGAAGQLHANLSSAFLHAVVGGMVTAYPPKSINVNYSNWQTIGSTIGISNMTMQSLLGKMNSVNSIDLNDGVTNLQKLGSVVINSVPKGQTALANLFFFDASLKQEAGWDSMTSISVASSSLNVQSSSVTSGVYHYTCCPSGTEYSLVSMYYKGIRFLGLTPTTIDSDFKYLFSMFWAAMNDPSLYTPPMPTVYNPADKSLYADGYSVMNHALDNVIGRIGALQGIQAGINVQLGDYAGTLAQINDAIKALTQAQVTSVDATDAAEKAADDTVNKGRDTTAPKNPTMPDMTIPQVITRKFPFSIPWDLYNSITILSSPGEAPKWVFPFGKESITVDMSPYNGVAAVARWGISLLFLIALIILTSRVIKH